MRRSIAILSLIIISTLFFTLSAFALTKGERDWKEDILTLLSLVKRVGDYSEVVELIEVAPALKKDPEIRKAFITFAPPGATPPEWAREEEPVLPAKIEIPKEIPVEVKEEPAPPAIVEVPEKIVTLPTPRLRQAGAEAQKEKERRKMKEEEARRIAQEVAVQRKVREKEEAPPEIIKEEPKIEAPKGIEVVTEGPPEKIGVIEEAPVKEEIKEELGAIPTPLPQGAKVIYSTDVVSGVKAEMVGGKTRVTITLSGERKYTVSEMGRPPAVIIDIPHTINAIFPETIPINKGCLRMIKATQHRSLPVDETRIMVILNRETEYRVTHKDNEIYIDFEE